MKKLTTGLNNMGGKIAKGVKSPTRGAAAAVVASPASALPSSPTMTTTADDPPSSSSLQPAAAGSSGSTPLRAMASESSSSTGDGVPPAIPAAKKAGVQHDTMGPTTDSSTMHSLQDQLQKARDDLELEKKGKRKLFHSLVKVANELRRTRTEAELLKQQAQYAEKNWYEGGLWRAPAVLPGAAQENEFDEQQSHNKPQRSLLSRQPISLSDLFFNLVVVTAFTRVGVAVSEQGSVDGKALAYFAVFWTVWSKEAGYSTRFDTTDLSAQVETLITCFCVLFASLSVHAPLNSPDGTRIMMMMAMVAILHCALHVRVALANYQNRRSNNMDGNNNNPIDQHVMHYAVFNIVMMTLEAACWLVGIVLYPVDWPYRWCIFAGGIVLALRVPRAFLANDFHAACSQRGVLFILLLGFLLQSIVVVASDFFEYQTPTLEHYSFIGSACLMLFCIKLLYVDDSDTLAEDHALLVNRFAAFFFNIGQFSLLVSTTVMGSGLNLLTHDYMAASAALPGPAKTLVTGGFSAVLLSTFFIKSMHLKRVPTDPRNQALFIGAYVVQGVVLLIVVCITAAMALGLVTGGFLQSLMAADIQLLFTLSGAALFLVVMSWLDEGVELALYESAADSREFRVHPFGLWWCLKPDVSEEDFRQLEQDAAGFGRSSLVTSTSRLSVLSPLLGSSMADLKAIRAHEYQSISSGTLDLMA